MRIGSNVKRKKYGENFPELLEKRIALMKKHRRDKPSIDPEFMFRVKNDPYQ